MLNLPSVRKSLDKAKPKMGIADGYGIEPLNVETSLFRSQLIVVYLCLSKSLFNQVVKNYARVR